MHARSPLPLVVDLDGTLIANDVLFETASRFVSQHPLRAHRLIGWAARGKGVLKQELWAAAPVRVDLFTYHDELLGWLREEKAAGRRLVLASASDQGAVAAVADHIGLFDDAVGSRDGANLAAAAKAEELVDRYSERGYEYVGNSDHDTEVWRHAAVAHVVSSRATIAAKAQRSAPLGRTFAPPGGGLRPWMASLRPHQWAKNALILLPLLTAQRLGDASSVIAALLGLVAFCLAASSVYLLNDLADVEHDRHHPTKRLRPLAAGTLSLATAWATWPVLGLAGLAVGLAVSPLFVLTLVAYLALTMAYSFSLKRKPVVDVLTLAALYTLRIVAGAAAIDVVLSVWLLSFSGFFFLSLALVKRVSELFRTRLDNTAATGRGYQSQDLELLSSYGVATSVVSVLVFTLFVNDPTTADQYRTPEALWATVPVLLWWLMRIWLRAHRGEMNEDPILFAVRDRFSALAGGLILAIFLLAHYAGR